MRYLTPDPDLHSTDEVIRSYHEHHGDMDLRSYWPKMLASVTTIAFSGSVALEGPRSMQARELAPGSGQSSAVPP
jgi:CIC family chloride channel protein